MQVVLVGLLALMAVHGVEDSVTTLDSGELSAAKKVKVRLWTHVGGAPKGHPVELELPDGQRADVMEIVASKEVERASAELHHSQVKETQQSQISAEADEAAKASNTKRSLTDGKWERLRSEVIQTNKAAAKANKESAQAKEKYMEMKQTYQFSSKQEKKKMDKPLEAAKANKVAASVKDEEAKEKSKQLEDKFREVSALKDQVDSQADQDRLDAVGAAVRLRVTKEQTERLAYRKLKAEVNAKLSVEKRSREHWKQKRKAAKANIQRAKEYLNMMKSGDGKKAAERSLAKAKREGKEAADGFQKAQKAVTEVSTKLAKTEADFKKKRAHKSFMTAAKAAAAAADADKAFAAAITAGDKRAKEAAALEAHKELKRVDNAARESMAAYENQKFMTKQAKQAEETLMKEEKEEKEEKLKRLETAKKEQELSKDALQDFGKPPK